MARKNESIKILGEVAKQQKLSFTKISTDKGIAFEFVNKSDAELALKLALRVRGFVDYLADLNGSEIHVDFN